jgi:hypothetical protein
MTGAETEGLRDESPGAFCSVVHSVGDVLAGGVVGAGSVASGLAGVFAVPSSRPRDGGGLCLAPGGVVSSGSFAGVEGIAAGLGRRPPARSGE